MVIRFNPATRCAKSIRNETFHIVLTSRAEIIISWIMWRKSCDLLPFSWADAYIITRPSFQWSVKQLLWILFYTLSGVSSVSLTLSPDQAILFPPKNCTSFQTPLPSSSQLQASGYFFRNCTVEKKKHYSAWFNYKRSIKSPDLGLKVKFWSTRWVLETDSKAQVQLKFSLIGRCCSRKPNCFNRVQMCAVYTKDIFVSFWKLKDSWKF